MNTRLTVYIDHAEAVVYVYDNYAEDNVAEVTFGDLLEKSYEVVTGPEPWRTERVEWWAMNTIDLRTELEAKARQWAQGITTEPFTIEHI